jgi:hypothetical protein
MSGDMLGQFALALEKLGWDANDELSVEIGGVAVTGTATHPMQIQSGQSHLELLLIKTMLSS